MSHRVKMHPDITYTSPDGFTGVLYNWHFDWWTGSWNYSMRITYEGKEVLHAYNAGPRNLEQLKKVVGRQHMTKLTELIKKIVEEEETE